MGDILGVAKISNTFGGCLKFLIFFWGEGGAEYTGPEPTYEENESIPTPRFKPLLDLRRPQTV